METKRLIKPETLIGVFLFVMICISNDSLGQWPLVNIANPNPGPPTVTMMSNNQSPWNANKEFRILQDFGTKMLIRELPNVVGPGGGNWPLSAYTFFLSPSNNSSQPLGLGNYMYSSQASGGAFHFHNRTGAAIVSHTPHNFDWGQGIIASVTRPATAAIVVNQNGADRIALYGAGFVAAQVGFWTFSDENIKTNVEEIEDALDMVNDLQGVYFDFVDDVLCDSCNEDSVLLNNDLGRQMGVIAQDVEDVVPEVVRSLGDAGTTKAVNYGALVGLLIEAVQELSAQVDACCGDMRPADGNTTDGPSAAPNWDELSSGYTLEQNIPNPAHGTTVINYQAPEAMKDGKLIIFDMQGKLIKTYNGLSTGKNSVTISAGELHAGMYYYTLIGDGKEVATKKMILTE